MGNLQTPKPKFHCDNITIPVSEDLTLISFTMDYKPKFDKQIANVTRKVSQQLTELKRLRNIVPLYTRKSIWQSFFAPHFGYCSDVWHFSSKTASDKLEKVNERALCFVLKDKRSSDTELLKKLGTVSLYDQRIMKITSCVFKVLNNDIPSTLKDLPLRRSTTHNLCGKDILTLRKVNSTNNGLRSWRYLAPKTWNMWPEALKYESKLNSFKRRLKKENLLTYYLPTYLPTHPPTYLPTYLNTYLPTFLIYLFNYFYEKKNNSGNYRQRQTEWFKRLRILPWIS